MPMNNMSMRMGLLYVHHTLPIAILSLLAKKRLPGEKSCKLIICRKPSHWGHVAAPRRARHLSVVSLGEYPSLALLE